MNKTNSKFKVLVLSAIIVGGLFSTSAMARGNHYGYHGSGSYHSYHRGGSNVGSFLIGAVIGSAITGAYNGGYYNNYPRTVVYNTPPIYQYQRPVYQPYYVQPPVVYETAPVQEYRRKVTVQTIDRYGNVISTTTRYED